MLEVTSDSQFDKIAAEFKLPKAAEVRALAGDVVPVYVAANKVRGDWKQRTGLNGDFRNKQDACGKARKQHGNGSPEHDKANAARETASDRLSRINGYKAYIAGAIVGATADAPTA